MSQEKFGNFFARPQGTYPREVALPEYYVSDAARYLSIMTGKTLEETKTFVLSQIRPGGKFEFKSPQVVYLERGENGDRAEKRGTMWNYIQTSLKAEDIIAPTFTTYISPKIKVSKIAQYIEGNIKARNVAKKAELAAEAKGDHVVAAVKGVEQKGRKLSNNAISGAHNSPSTPLFNKTAHSTLTSTCRTTAGYGNANNEKYITGNRHYHNYQITLNNIVAIVQNANYELLEQVVQKYGIHLPTAEEAGACVAYSSQFYWWDRKQAEVIAQLLQRLTPIQRAAFVYSGDLFHLRKHNENLVRNFLVRLSTRVAGTHPDPLKTVFAAPESYVNLAHQLCAEETRGRGKTYTEWPAENLQTLACTLENIADVIYEHRDLIEAFWQTDIMPASVAYFPESVRRSALTSDTDSTIFTVQEWIEWYNVGKFEFNTGSRGIYLAVVFLASSTITHILAKMSANLGIIPEHQSKIQMKSEFTFDVFVPTQLGKHYFAAISCREGNVFKEYDYEIKGAQLRSANAPVWIIEEAKKMMKEIIHTVLDNKTISLKYYLTWVADIERKIETSIKSGERTYLRRSSIKDIGSYATDPEDSPYQHHFLWNEVFAPKYGVMAAPPYDTYKLSILADKPGKCKLWLENMQDKELAGRMKAYLERNERNAIGTMHMPREIMDTTGIPKEVIEVIDIERIQMDICRIYTIILETLGYYSMGDKVKRLLSKSGY